MLVGNLLFIIWDEHSEALIVGRLLIGFAHGITYVALITHAGENAAKNMRGTILSIINCMLYTGIFVSVITTGTVRFTWFGPLTISGERIIAIIGILLSVASIACITTMSVETIPFLLRRNDRFSAMINLKHLRDSHYETLQLSQEMEEFDLMIVQDKQNSGNIFSNGNAKPLMLMIVLRLMVALTNNYYMNVAAITFSSDMFYIHQYRLVPIAVVASRFAMSIIQIFYADLFKRKVQIIASAMSSAFLLILFGILLNTLQFNFYNFLTIVVLFGVLWSVFQFTCSIGMDQMQDVYLSEAFSTAKKPWSISFVAGIEHSFHIFMIGMYYLSFTRGNVINIAYWNSFIFGSGASIILCAIVLVFTLPETRNMSLKQAKDSFVNHSINIFSPFA